ncbi:hypothetical protein rosag_28390 [Roseisolibacter agri]|uniref:Uncharacterized protein n=1 Tax=Roseisolibacter agri TaxID=2014610 RepID=A0AA37QAX1_9BACT|nr:hypothetical protein rosag_28390 [Roseisolibacter agri]
MNVVKYELACADDGATASSATTVAIGETRARTAESRRIVAVREGGRSGVGAVGGQVTCPTVHVRRAARQAECEQRLAGTERPLVHAHEGA